VVGAAPEHSVKVLVTGANGQLGHEIVAQFEGLSTHEVVACDHLTVDVTDRDAVLATIAAARPDSVVNCAAWTAVDACESDPARAFLVNGLAVRHLTEACRRFDTHLCQISTDYVFSGDKADPYQEWDRTDPRSIYGASKLAGENETDTAATVVRTAWVVGAHGSNMVKTVLRLAEEHETLQFVDDQHGAPSHAGDIAAIVARLVIDRRPGIFHATNQGTTTWFGLARAVMAAAGHDPDRVSPISTSDLDPPRPAPRPANSVLANTALEASGLPLARPWEEAVAELVETIT
jgi:dTDP-4-dehydrorhamnose reductase